MAGVPFLGTRLDTKLHTCLKTWQVWPNRQGQPKGHCCGAVHRQGDTHAGPHLTKHKGACVPATLCTHLMIICTVHVGGWGLDSFDGVCVSACVSVGGCTRVGVWLWVGIYLPVCVNSRCQYIHKASSSKIQVFVVNVVPSSVSVQPSSHA